MAKKGDVRPWQYGPDLKPLIADPQRRLLWINNILNHAGFFDQSDINDMWENIHRVTQMRVIDPADEVRQAAAIALEKITQAYQAATPANAEDVAYRTFNPVQRVYAK